MSNELIDTAFEAYPEHKMNLEANQPASDINLKHREGFIRGLQFNQWLKATSMTQPDIPLHIKYRMYKNQKKL